MEKIDIKSAKYVIFALVICLLFVITIANAYRYLPNIEPNVTVKTANTLGEPVKQEEVETTQEENSEQVSEQKKSDKDEVDEIDPIEFNKNALKNMENIDNENNTKVDVPTLANASKLFSEKKYNLALTEYYNVAKDTDDKSVQADCYEGIATIYAVSKRYGSALSYAQKAYTLYPNTSRELLLARIYYKTGKIDSATEKINDILRRDFDKD